MVFNGGGYKSQFCGLLPILVSMAKKPILLLREAGIYVEISLH